MPAVLFAYKNSDPSLMRDTSQYNTLLFSAIPPVVNGTQNPYTVRTFYEQLSNGMLSMRGQVFGWVRLDSNDVFYEGKPGTCSGNPYGTGSCNGIFSTAAIAAMQNGLRASLAHVDSFVDFGLFDNDGPDGIPNSGDDDGYVDMIMFAHATRDGACGAPSGQVNNHIWSHRFEFVDATASYEQDYVTNDVSHSTRPGAPADHLIHIRDYFISSGLGGRTSCDTTQIMPIGTASHEFGHALGLPDLYDTHGPTEGIGQWGLMGSGNFTAAYSPSRYEAWSLNEMGWTTVAPLTTGGTYHLRAEPISDTTFLINPTVPNPRNESFLIENRQAYQSDTALIRLHCARSVQIGQIPPGSPCSGGLLIWHVDGQKIASSGFHNGNTVNYLLPHGLVLEQADGLDHLDSPTALSRRGDAGDPYPGVTNNTAFAPLSNPAPKMNSDGGFPGFAIDSIRLTGGPDSQMSFRLRFGSLTVVRASDTTAAVQVAGATYNVYRNLLEQGGSYAVNFQDGQLSASGRSRFHFQSWSDGGAQSHNYIGSLAGGTLTANVTRDFKLIANATSGGTIQADTAIDLSGTFISEGRAVTLTATPNAGVTFGGWSGDTVTTNTVLTLPMGRPYTVTGSFGTLLISSPGTRPNGVMGASYLDSLKTTGGTGVNSWNITAGALPQGLALDGPSGVITGYPHQTGNFSFTASVTSGAQTQSRAFTMSVSAPTLATADVVTQLLGPGTPLNVDQVRYLDFLGNNNSLFDIGDFLAWVKTTGAPLTAAMMAAMQKKGSRP
ncbi:MAG TPA: M6 family metalloprotease domain-containing protein [Gemmatimonadales bacterium]|nr:M6 family metalloprotease domain-containing protein [Gemmatimonadales bacterium]